MDALEAMKAELRKMQEEKKCMEARLIAAEKALEEEKRILSEYKAVTKLADDLLCVLMEEGGHNVHENNSDQEDLDEETMKQLVEEAVRDFTEALSGASRPADGGNGGGSGGIDGGHSDSE